MLDYFFPASYVLFFLGIYIGISITSIFIGIVSTIGIIFAISIGMIRIKPLFNFYEKIVRYLFPQVFTTIEKNIKKTFQATGNLTLKKGKYIFMWHTHGIFASSLYFHNTKLTNWPEELSSKLAILNYINILPFANEFAESMNAISVNYDIMKKSLQDSSISLFPGGMREMLYTNTTLIKKRKGIFKLALETGSSLVPVIIKGEEELNELVVLPGWIQELLKPYDICIPIPTLKTISTVLSLSIKPLEPIYSIIGDPIPVEKVEEPSEQEIADLKQKYIEALKQMYKKEMGRDLKVI
jgi:hypothetical protein